jgi:hypothetical protein
LEQLKVYFSIHHIDEGHKISFSRFNLEGNYLPWWEINTKTLRLEDNLPVNMWEKFKTIINS